MRIIAGKYKSKLIPYNKKINARPTTDIAKEGLFNILENSITLKNIKVLDLFSGTGNIAYEFISRGAKIVDCVDKQINCVKFIHAQAKKWEMNIRTHKANVYSFIGKNNGYYDIIFADPPYNDDRVYEIPNLIYKYKLIDANGILVVEHGKNVSFLNYENFEKQRSYSSVNFSFFKKLTYE